jgi:hypothetical protein
MSIINSVEEYVTLWIKYDGDELDTSAWIESTCLLLKTRILHLPGKMSTLYFLNQWQYKIPTLT